MHLQVVSISRLVLCILFHLNFLFLTVIFSLLFHISVKKISIYNECITGIYTYSLCIYEYILILSTLVYVRNAKKKKKEAKNKHKKTKKAQKQWCLLVDHLAPACIFPY